MRRPQTGDIPFPFILEFCIESEKNVLFCMKNCSLILMPFYPFHGQRGRIIAMIG